MHALVTGGGGFLGSHIVRLLLARGDRVRSFGRGDYPQLSSLGVDVFRGDIRDAPAVAAACRGIDCVFHVAAMPGISMRRQTYEEINRLGTEHVIAACRAAHVGRLVYTSSPSVVFAGGDQCGIDESVPYDFAWMEANRAWYSLTKAHAEQAVLAANDGNLRTCALRPHLIWGPGDTHLIPRLIARARSSRLRRIGDGTNLVDITYVDNAADAHLQAADALDETHERAGASSPPAGGGEAASAAGRAYFISQGEPVNCWQWIDEILALADLPPVSGRMSFKSAWRIGTALEVASSLMGFKREPPMTRFLAAQLATSHWFDISAARRNLGYNPRVATAEGMQRLANWLRQS